MRTGLHLRYLGLSSDQNNHDSSGACVLRSEHDDKRVKRHIVHKDRGHILFAFVSVCVCVDGENIYTPNLSHMTDDTIIRGGKQGLGSPLCIFWDPLRT